MDQGVPSMPKLSGLILSVVLASCATVPAPAPDLNPSVPPTQRSGHPRFLAHFMPWYQAPPVASTFGWHWHMGFYDPFAVDAEGRRPLATHDPPLIGPYDSSDPRVIEYQLLTMKAAGIDGVILDWYGIDDVFDYAAVHRASQAVVDAVRRAGMTFAVCYEDQSIGKAVRAGKYDSTEALAKGSQALKWLEDHWFHDPAYLKFDGRPVLLDFGPQTFLRASDWQTLFSVTSVRPWFVSLENHLEHDADGFYNWPDMAASGGGTLTRDVLVNQLNRFYAATKNAPRLIASVWPGFHDIYQQAGVGASYGYLDYGGGDTFRMLLNAALEARPDVVQLATWNDYGEGTVLEPNQSRGYDPLEDLQNARRRLDPTFPFAAGDLRLPFELYKRRFVPSADQARLDALAAALFASQPDRARELASAAFGDRVALPRTPTAASAGAPAGSAAPLPAGTNLAYEKPRGRRVTPTCTRPTKPTTAKP